MAHWDEEGKFIREVGEVFYISDDVCLCVVAGNGKDCGRCYWTLNRGDVPHCNGTSRRETAGECIYRNGAAAVNFIQLKLNRNREKEGQLCIII